MQPHWFLNEDSSMSEAEFGEYAAAALEKKILELGADNVAAFIAEPVQGAGGVIVPPATYWPAIQKICNEQNILLVADEVICGFGRTGNWFGLPIGGVVVSDRVAEGLDRGGEFNHGYTYSGHPACASAALANIAIMQKENIVENVAAEIAPYFQKNLTALLSHENVGQVRGVGMLGAIQLVPDAKSKRFKKTDVAGVTCREHCLENGLVMRAVDDAMIISPPLTITTSQIDELFDKARRSIEQTFS